MGKMNEVEIILHNQWKGSRRLLPQIKYSDLVPDTDYYSSRKWVFDFQLEGTKILVEVQGSGGYGHGGNTKSQVSDVTKYRSVVVAGYTVLMLLAAEVRDRPDIAVENIEDLLRNHGYEL